MWSYEKHSIKSPRCNTSPSSTSSGGSTRSGKSALRLNRQCNLKEGDLTGHLRILKDFQINNLIKSKEDWLERKPNFGIPYRTVEIERESWQQGGPTIRDGSLCFYTDGSKMNGSAGAGFTGPGISNFFPMGHWPTVFQAEIYAIIECTNTCLERNYRHANICIFCDSQAALKALNSPFCHSKLVWECILSLRKLAMKNQVNLYWVPGHCGIEGNEKADLLARQGSSTNFVGPEPFCGISPSALKAELGEWEKATIKANWDVISGLRQSKRFIEPNREKSLVLLRLNKKDLRTFTGLITGHCPSKYHLKKIGKLDDDKCRLCGIESETSEHLLCECRVLIQRRLRIFGKGHIEPTEIWRESPGEVINFIRSALPNWDKCAM